jgi:hypothetical protein
MKKLSLIYALLLASFALSAQWVQQNTDVDGEFTDIVFVDENNGWTIKKGDYPDLYYTTNGGEEWQWCFEFFGLLQGPGSTIHFAGPDHGWFVGNYDCGCGIYFS